MMSPNSHKNSKGIFDVFRQSRSDKPRSKVNSTPSAPLPRNSARDELAILPPKKVIKALFDYNVEPGSQGHGYLNFNKGDFFNVVGRENDPDWFDACNPMANIRGLVPVSYFEVVGKQVRGTTGFDSAPQHDSGYAEKNDLPAAMNGGGRSRPSQQMGRSGAMVYGVVQYDFHAERPDELEAKAGEAIIVIAQSNPEWFVAKPIMRLGGPGLIPVAFVQIHDMTSGQPVTDGGEAVRRAGVPKVEEWKRMAAEYKNSSIPLGKFDSGSAANNLTQGMDRLSMNSRGSGSHHANSIDPRTSQAQPRTATPTQQQYQAPNMSIRHSQMVSPVRAKVPSYRTVNEEFMFVVEAVTEDGKCWELQRHYKDFYGLQLLLIEQFPAEAGKMAGHKRRIPYMPGPLPWVTERLTQERRGHLDKYLKDLLVINREITTSHPVCAFFTPKEGDREISPGADFDMAARYSQASQQSSVAEDYNGSSTSNLHNMDDGYGSPSRQQQRTPSSGPHLRNPSDTRHMNGQAPPPMDRNNSAFTNASATSVGTGYGSIASTGSNPGHQSGAPVAHSSAPIRIKAWLGERSCVMIRLAPTFNYDELVQKIRERWSMEMNISPEEMNERGMEFEIQYRDEQYQQYRSIANDDDVNEAKERCERLTLWVSSPQAV